MKIYTQNHWNSRKFPPIVSVGAFCLTLHRLLSPFVTRTYTFEIGSSPYITPTYTLEIGPNKVKYSVPEAFLMKFPKLLDLKESDLRSKTLLLPDVNDIDGHTLVHYLYTGTYQIIKLHDLPSDLMRLIRYRKGLLFYRMAKRYNIVGLDDLAKHEVELASSGIPIDSKLDSAVAFYQSFLKMPGSRST
jgi:hypothetical protein